MTAAGGMRIGGWRCVVYGLVHVWRCSYLVLTCPSEPQISDLCRVRGSVPLSGVHEVVPLSGCLSC